MQGVQNCIPFRRKLVCKNHKIPLGICWIFWHCPLIIPKPAACCVCSCICSWLHVILSHASQVSLVSSFNFLTFICMFVDNWFDLLPILLSWNSLIYLLTSEVKSNQNKDQIHYQFDRYCIC